MQSTKIIRRIDELGRVVVPKEIRKTMRIKSGDALEFFAEDESLVLKKYSPYSSAQDICRCVAEALKESIEKEVIIADKERVVASTLKYLDGEQLSTEVLKHIDGKTVMFNESEGGQILYPFTTKQLHFTSQIILPFYGEELLGYLIVMGDSPVTKEDVRLATLSSSILVRSASVSFISPKSTS